MSICFINCRWRWPGKVTTPTITLSGQRSTPFQATCQKWPRGLRCWPLSWMMKVPMATIWWWLQSRLVWLHICFWGSMFQQLQFIFSSKQINLLYEKSFSVFCVATKYFNYENVALSLILNYWKYWMTLNAAFCSALRRFLRLARSDGAGIERAAPNNVVSRKPGRLGVSQSPLHNWRRRSRWERTPRHPSRPGKSRRKCDCRPRSESQKCGFKMPWPANSKQSTFNHKKIIK